MIKNISLKDAIRKRPAMYIGCLDQRGIEIVIADLLVSLDSGSIHFTLIHNTIHLRIENTLSSRYRKIFENENPVYDEYSQIYTLACLSSSCELLIEGEDNVILKMKGKSGCFECNFETIECYEYKHGKVIDFKFTPDGKIFQDRDLSFHYFVSFFEKQSYLLPYLFRLKDENSGMNVQFRNPKGISDLADLFIHKLRHKPKFRLDEKFKIDNFQISWTICLMDCLFWDSAYLKIWINNESIFGGSLHNGISKGLSKILKEDYSLGNVCVFAQIRGNGFSYQGALKTHLNMPDLEQKVEDYIVRNSEFVTLCII